MPPLSAERRKLSAMQQEKETISQESHVFTRRQLASMTLPFILDSLSIMLISMLITALISSAGESSVAAVNLVSPHLYIDRLPDERHLRRWYRRDRPELRQPGHGADESGCRTHSLDDLSVRHGPEPGTDPVPKAHSDSPVSPGRSRRFWKRPSPIWSRAAFR